MLRSFILASSVLLALATASAASSELPCDPTGLASDEEVLASIRSDIDQYCPCESASSRGAYRRCAKDRVRVFADRFSRSCLSRGFEYARRSTCGAPGSVVCCRIDADGNARHGIARDAGHCIDTRRYSVCIANAFHSPVDGCDASGCVPGVCGNGIVDNGESCEPPGTLECNDDCQTNLCGNGVVDDGETCDPPGTPDCDDSCQSAPCDTIPSGCGNLAVDAGEDCDPPGVGSCDRFCRTASCSAPATGELDIACAEGGSSIAAAATDTGYLLSWNGAQRHAGEILARRFRADGSAADSTVTVVSDEMSCTSDNGPAVVASDGSGYYVYWYADQGLPSSPGFFLQMLRGRRVGRESGMETTDEIAEGIPVGTCRTGFGSPLAATATEPSLFGLSYVLYGSCYGNLLFREARGVFGDFRSTPMLSSLPLGYPAPSMVPPVSTSGASAASLDGSTLWTWFGLTGTSPSGPFRFFVASAWSDGTTTTSPFELSSSFEHIGSRPAVAAGDGQYLVVWRQGASDDAASTTEIRATRVTRADGRIDADGGLLLATVPGGISAGPSVAFDGTRWLVAWTETAMSGDELRALALEVDMTPVDITPRLLATQVARGEPAMASAGDGKVLVAFRRAESGQSAVRAVLLEP